MNNKIQNLICFFLLSAILSGCSAKGSRPASPAAKTPQATEEPFLKIASVEEYNRTGNLQKESFYEYSGSVQNLKHTVTYTYNDSGKLVTVKKTGGGIDTDRFVESYLYSGKLCTQRIVYDSNGGTEQVFYWTYSGDTLKSERHEQLIPAPGGGYSGRLTEYTEFNPDGTKSFFTSSTEGDYSRNDYEYDEAGNLVKDSSSHSSDGKTFRTYDVFEYFYDEQTGLKTSEQRTDRYEELYYLELLEYDENGRLIKDTAYAGEQQREDDDQLWQRLYEYNESGSVSWENYTEGNTSVQIFYEYDERGNLLSRAETEYTVGKAAKTLLTAWEYDSRSNPVKETEKRPDGVERINYIREFSYYEDGKTKTITNYAPYG